MFSLTNDVLNRLRKTVVVILLSTSAKANPPITAPIISLKNSVAIIDQIRAFSRHHLQSKISKAESVEMEAICIALIEILDLT